MAKKKTPSKKEYKDNFIQEQSITDTLELNYMPYAMSVIVSRAIPEIDGFKPSHRKLLYTMYQMGLLKGDRTKSAVSSRSRLASPMPILTRENWSEFS